MQRWEDMREAGERSLQCHKHVLEGGHDDKFAIFGQNEDFAVTMVDFCVCGSE